MTPEIVTIASIPAILALTNLAKSLGLSGKVSALLAVVLGVALAVAQHELAGYGWYQAAVQGMILGLSAAGLYDVSKPRATGSDSYEPMHRAESR
nr:MAG TPA: holin [Caudoviricetes sp.]